jgi:hypothetical protein
MSITEGLWYGLIFFLSLFCTLIANFFLMEITIHGHLLPIVRRHVFLLYIVLVGFIQIYLFANREYYKIKKHKSSYGVIVQLDSLPPIISDSTNYYIGKTNNYIFIYHEKTAQTTVYPISRVKELIFPIEKKKVNISEKPLPKPFNTEATH